MHLPSPLAPPFQEGTVEPKMKTVAQWAAEIDRDLRLNLTNGRFAILCDRLRVAPEREAKRLLALGSEAVRDELARAEACGPSKVA